MALFDNGIKLGTVLALGLGAIILGPVAVPVVAAVVKPLVKGGIKGGMMLYVKAQETLAETREVLEDLAAEAQAELAQEREMAAGVATGSEAGTGDAA
jgi:hypothetical protein